MQWALAAAPGHPVLAAVLRMSLDRVVRDKYNVSSEHFVHNVTGVCLDDATSKCFVLHYAVRCDEGCACKFVCCGATIRLVLLCAAEHHSKSRTVRLARMMWLQGQPPGVV